MMNPRLTRTQWIRHGSDVSREPATDPSGDMKAVIRAVEAVVWAAGLLQRGKHGVAQAPAAVAAEGRREGQ